MEKYKNIDLYSFVSESDLLMQLAKSAAVKFSLTPTYPIGIVLVNNGKVLCESGNGNGYHENNIDSKGHISGCVRKFISQERLKAGGEKIKAGEEFDLCPGCHTDYHAEANLIRKALELDIDTTDCDIYMYGHYWCCGECWVKIKMANITKVVLPNTYKKFEDPIKVKEWAKEVSDIRLKNE